MTAFTPARRRAANGFRGLIGRVTDGEPKMRDRGTTAYFPDPTKDYQIANNGPVSLHTSQVWAKKDCPLAEETILLPKDAKPVAGDLIQDSDGMVCWLVQTVLKSPAGYQCHLERLNFPGKPVSSEGFIYLVSAG